MQVRTLWLTDFRSYTSAQLDLGPGLTVLVGANGEGKTNLLEGVRRVKLLAREATPVRLAMSNDGLDLVAVTQDVGQAHESLDAKYEGAELTVAFNPDYLLQGIEVLPGDEVLIESVDSLKPALVKSPEHPEFLYLLMPVRVS